MRSALSAARRERTHQLVMPPAFWLVEPGDIGSWTSTRNGYSAKLFETTAVTDRANLDVGLSLQEVDPNDYDWNHDTDYTAPTSGPTTFPRPEPQGVLSWAAEGYTLLDKDGFTRRPAIQLSWDGDVPGCVGVQYELAHQDPVTDEWVTLSRNRTDQIAAGALIIWSGLIPNEPYQVRGQYIPAAPRDMLWSDWIDVTTPDVKLSILDFNAALHAQVVTLQQQVQDLENSNLALISSVAANQDARNWIDKKQARTQLAAQAGSLSASITEAKTVAADATAALAETVDTVSATVDGNTASIETTQTAVATINGQLAASYSVKLTTGDYWTDLTLTNGGVGTSTVKFRTDNFVIGLPGTAADKQIFTVGTVKGSTQVALNADDILLDGSVKATKFDVAELTAISAAFGNATVSGNLTGASGKTLISFTSDYILISD